MKKLTKSPAPSRVKHSEKYAASINEARATAKPVDYEARLELIRQAAEKYQPTYGLLLSVENWQ